MKVYLAGVMCLLGLALFAKAQEPPAIPAGLDAYRLWQLWPLQRIGERAYMRSTYDRTGGNESADASHFLYQNADDFNVTLDVEGPGILYFCRYNHWHGSPWHYVVDGVDHIMTETSTADPKHPVANSVFEPRAAMPNPLTWTWSATRGADLTWLPIGFGKSFQMAYSRTRYGTGYYIYHQYVPGAKLSSPIQTWDGKTAPDHDVLDLINRAGTNLAPAGEPGIVEQVGNASLAPNQTVLLAQIEGGPQMLRAIDFSVPQQTALDFSNARLRITWDDRSQPSVDAPLAIFFGAGVFYNRDHREYLVKAFPMNVRYEADRVRMACYFPMPFFHNAKVELVGADKAISDITWSLRHSPYTGPLNHVGYFHATYRDHPRPELGRDLVLLDTRDTEAGGDWTGSFVGTSFIFSHNANLGTLEGDPRFYFDDSMSPQAQGTGTEEWAGGGDYWGGLNMTLPFAGHPTGARNPKEAKDDTDKIESAYRFLLADLMPFGKNARITLEHGGTNESTEHYETVTYWYGLPGASLVKTDTLHVGDAASEQQHAYSSPQASQPYEIESRFEWGVDTIKGKEIFPATRDRGRTTLGTSEFVVKLQPGNLGVMLRRKLDYSYANQRAEVFIADATDPATAPDWQPAGVWYLAGSSTCVFSNPPDELGATQHVVQTSNRRFREDEFLIPRPLTQGRGAIRVRVKFTPVARKLFPGGPDMNNAWSEMRYDACCFVMPLMPK